MNTSHVPTVPAAGEEATQPTVRAAARRGQKTSAPELVLGRYRLGRRLGSGAFGSVYAGRDERLERDVAIKILPRERIMGGRFEREARAAARLAHPAIVTLYEAAVDDEGAYLVSELVRGRTLDKLLAEGHLSDRDILAIVASLCDALDHAHEQGVIHRDVKPSNVLVPARPSSPDYPAKLTDFGVARIVGGDSLTRTGDVIGTMAYMAPEQAEGLGCIGPAADLYSTALVTYEALTGVNPLGPLGMTGRTRRLGTYLPPVRRQRRDLPRTLGVAIDQALRPRPGERGDLRDLRAALEQGRTEVGDLRGVVVPGWRGSDPAPTVEEDAPGPEWRDPVDGSARAAGLRAGGTEGRGRAMSLTIRGAGGVCAALTCGWVAAHLLNPSPLAPAVVGVLAAAVVLLSPRVGWLCAILALAGAAALQGRPGGALMLILAAGLSLLLLAPVSRVWPASPGAAVLAVVGLAGAWPAFVARSGLRAWQRAALAGAGFLWIAAAAPMAAPRLFGDRPALPPASVWTNSLPVTMHDVVMPLISGGVLAVAAVWAVAAAVLPWIARGRQPALDLVVVTVWSAVTVAAAETLGPPQLRGAVAGAVAGAVIVLAPGLPRWVGQVRHGAGLLTRVP